MCVLAFVIIFHSQCCCSYLSSQVVTRGQVLEAVETVPMSRSTSTRVVMDNLKAQSSHGLNGRPAVPRVHLRTGGYLNFP